MMGMGNNITSELRDLNVTYGLTYTPGYVSTNGSITPPSSSALEVTSDFIANPFKTDERYYAVIEYVNKAGSSATGWIGIGLYDDNKSFRTRVTFSANIDISKGSNKYTVFAPTPFSYNDGLCRISFRTYGEANLYIVPAIALLTDVFNQHDISGHADS
jgi:hypothetical protein